MPVTAVVTRVYRTTPVATGTVPSARRNRAEWLEARLERLLPVEYFHVVFTLPAALHPLVLHHPRRLYDLLFLAVPRACSAWPPIRNGWGRRSGSRPFCTPGDKTCRFIPICIVWSPGAGSVPMAVAGLPAGRAICFR